MLPRVFDLFTQADRSLDRSQGGLGIGLTLVRRLVEMHGGDGRGPQRRARAGAASSSSACRPPPTGRRRRRRRGREAPAAPGRPLRVLVVDDNVDAAESLATLLRLRATRCGWPTTGRRRWQAAAAFRPGGRPARHRPAGHGRLRGGPAAAAPSRRPRGGLLVAVTGYGQDEDRRRSREAGFDHHLVKPVDFGALHQVLGAVGRPTAIDGSAVAAVPDQSTAIAVPACADRPA